MTTQLCRTDTPESCAQAVANAAGHLSRGEVVALPTETVYGLAADAMRPDAVVKIFEAKERPFFDPLIVHLPDLEWLERIADARDPLAQKLIEKFWPGPLTLVLPRREIVPDIVTAGLDTVAVRMSTHPIFREVIQTFGKPLAAPSANRFGRISPTAAEHVYTELNNRIPFIVDGGPTVHGIESTIVSVEGTRIQILRSGPITPDDLVQFGEVVLSQQKGNPIAPGQLKSHYAPHTPMMISDFKLQLADYSEKRIGLLAWNEIAKPERFVAVEFFSKTKNLHEAAATFFAKMRALDEADLDLIIAEPVPEIGLGIAIMDRLRKGTAKGLATDGF